MGYFVQSPNQIIWFISIGDNGLITSTQENGLLASNLILRDANLTTAWQIGVDNSGYITTTRIPLLSSYPSFVQITSDSNNTTWDISVTSDGILIAINVANNPVITGPPVVTQPPPPSGSGGGGTPPPPPVSGQTGVSGVKLMGVQSQINGVLSITDNLSGSIQLQKQINLSYLGTISEFAQSQTVGTTPTVVNLPAVPTQFVYIKNLSTSATILVNWTPNGSSAVNVLTLQPGSFIFFLEGNTTSGITTLTLTGSALGTPVEYILVA